MVQKSSASARESAKDGGSPVKSKRLPGSRMDWDAIKRDYRPGTFTLREMAAKHETDHATIARKIKADRLVDPDAWPRDLTAAVRAATNAKLMQAMVTNTVTSGQQEVTNVILAAAEVNSQVILRHRLKLAEVTAAADAAKTKVLSLLDTVADIREAATAMGAIEAWSRITKTVVDKEREAFNLDDAPPPPDTPATQDWASKSAADGMAAYLRMVHGQ